MSDLLTRRLALLSSASHRPLLGQGLRGIERETLRVDRHGHLALTPHPQALGSALTHPQITTDYSESLLEFITPAEPDIGTVLEQLDAIHRYVYTKLGDELLWSQSMPGVLPEEAEIPIAWYGKSHIGMLKHVYRRGLAVRYGKSMQCIAGIHYNFSLAEPLWRVLQEAELASADVAMTALDYQSERYIALIRNFHRYSWLLMYLFGASPAMAAGFLREPPPELRRLSADTLYLPHATSLRMSDFGYKNNAQAGLMPPYNTLRSYMTGLARAVRQPYPPYEKLGMRRDGEWLQLNTNLLQIENEFYATIRPKRVIHSGERPLEALCARGVQYIEVRCLDVDPFQPLGIGLEESRFLDAFLLFCALDHSAPTDAAESRENAANFAATVKHGRQPGLMLQRQGSTVGLQAWGRELLARIGAVATVLDAQRGGGDHANALQAQADKLEDVALTPSARALAALAEHEGSFARFGLAQSEAHAANFRARALSEDEEARFAELGQLSLAEQERMEQADANSSFDDYILAYRDRTPAQLCE